MELAEFQDTVLKGVKGLETRTETIQTKTEKLLGDFDRLDGETKKTFDEITTLKKHANDAASNAAQLERKLAIVEAQLLRQVRASFGDPIRSFFDADPTRGDYVMGCFRRAKGIPLTVNQKTAVTGVDSGIGTAVTPQETAAMIYDALLTYGQWNTLGVIPVGSRTQVLPITTVRPTAYWIAQGAQITEGAITGSSNTVTIGDCCAWIPVANSLLEDDTVDMSAYLTRQLVEAVAYRLDWACFAADGTADSTDGGYTGIAVGGTAATAAGGNTTVAALDLEDFVRCLTTVSAACLQRPCKWWIHPQILAKIVQVRDLNGRSIFQTANEAPSPGAIGSILGYPVIVTGAMPSTDSAGNVVAVFGEPAACAVGLRRDINLANSSDFQFDYNRTAYRAIARAGVAIQAATSFAMLTLPAA